MFWQEINLDLTHIRLLWLMVTKQNINNIQLFMCERSQKYTQLCPNMQKYPILVQNQVILYVHKASIMVDHCTQYEQTPRIHLRYITTNIHNFWKMDINSTFLAHSQDIFYMHQVHVMVDYCSKYKQNRHREMATST